MWQTMIISKNDGLMMARRIKYFNENNIEYLISFCKGIVNEELIMIEYKVPEEGIDFLGMYK